MTLAAASGAMDMLGRWEGHRLTIADERPLADPRCWISLRTAEANGCAISIAGSLTADAGRLIRRWVVLLRDGVGGDVTIHCDALQHIDAGGLTLLRELIWGLEAQRRHVHLVGLTTEMRTRVHASTTDPELHPGRCVDERSRGAGAAY